MDYNNLSDDELFQELRKLPDFDKLPLPISWYKKYNIPFSDKIVNPKQYIQEGYWLKCQYNPTTTWEIRTVPAPGGVRDIVNTEEVKADLVDSKYQDFTERVAPLISQIVSDNQQETQKALEDSTTGNTTSIQHE